MLTRMTEEDWATVLEVFRGCRFQRGAKGQNDRIFLEAVHYFCVHNITWRALPAECGNWNSVWKRLTTYRFRPEVVDGGRLGMVEARSWTERVLGWVGSSMRPGASAGCWASGCRGNARRNGRISRFWLRPC